MKKIVFISGIVSIQLMLLGSVCKVMHWPGGNLLLIASIIIFAFFALPVSLYLLLKSANQKLYRGVYIVTYFVFGLTMVSALFKIMHWPGSELLLLISLPTPFVVFLPVYLLALRKDKNVKVSNIMGIMFGLVFFAVFSVLLSLSASKNSIDQLQNKWADNEKVGDYYDVVFQLKEKSEITKKATELCQYIDELKCQLMISSGNTLCTTGSKLNPLYLDSIQYKDNTNAYYQVFYGENEKFSLSILQQKIEELVKTIIEAKKYSEADILLVQNLLNTQIQNINGQERFWQRVQFPTQHLVVVLHGLTRIENNAKFIVDVL